ncbi:MAG: DUF6273 domain-containing protein, partial [Treponema sp.]|nr:DUF6273 domain-containing protein [Treponema sp.]
EEADKYFGNSGDYLNKKRKNGNQIADSNGYWLSNNHDGERVAKDGNGTACWWWLRSPGDVSRDAAYVDVGGGVGVYGGRVYVNGIKVILDYGGVRPALWLNL